MNITSSYPAQGSINNELTSMKIPNHFWLEMKNIKNFSKENYRSESLDDICEEDVYIPKERKEERLDGRAQPDNHPSLPRVHPTIVKSIFTLIFVGDKLSLTF